MRLVIPAALAAMAILLWGSMLLVATPASARIDNTRLVICVDPLNMPYSERSAYPPGFDVEIGQALAKELKRSFDIYWADTGTRGGLGRALRRSISSDQCNAFMGLPHEPHMIDEMEEKQLVLTRPYMSVGLVLVQPKGATPITEFDGLGAVSTAVQLGTLPQHLLMQAKFRSTLYRDTQLALTALTRGETDVALLFGPFVGWYIQENYQDKLTITTEFERRPEWHWNLAIAVHKDEPELVAALNAAIGKMLEDGRIAKVVGSYGVHFVPPSDNGAGN